MERAVDAGGLRSPPIGGAQRSEGAGEGGGGRILKFVFEYGFRIVKVGALRETIFRKHYSSAYGNFSGVI